MTEPLPAVTVGGASLTGPQVLRRLHQRRRLLPLFREAAVELVLIEEAARAGLAITPQELQGSANAARRRMGLNDADATRAWLARVGLTVLDFEEALERDLLIAKVRRHLTEAHVAGHFAAHRGRYARAQLRQLVVASAGVAGELLAQLNEEGRDFAELAREHSLHGPTRLAGGSLGLVPRSALPAAAADAIFAAKPGAVVGPFGTEQGFHLFLVEALPEVSLDEETATAIRQELFDAWLAERLRDVRIDMSWLGSS